MSDAICSLARVGCATHTAYADCNYGVCRLQTASAASLIQSCKTVLVQFKVCRSQQLLLNLVTKAHDGALTSALYLSVSLHRMLKSQSL